MNVREPVGVLWLALVFALASAGAATAGSERVSLSGRQPSAVAGLAPKGRLPATRPLSLSLGLPLRNQAALDVLLGRIYDPKSPDFHKFLTSEEFTARFGPTEPDYQAVITFAEANGLRVEGKHPNRVVLDVRGSVASVERAFKVTLRTYRHPTEARDFFAPDTGPTPPANLPVADMWGLSDYGPPKPLAHKIDPLKIRPLNYNGSGPNGAYQGGDFRNAYVPGTSLTGSGQVAAVAEFDGYYAADIAGYESKAGYAAVPLQNVLLDGVSGAPGYSGVSGAVSEVSLDLEMIIAMAPGLSKLIVYEGNSPYDVLNRIVTDNLAKQVSSSWFWAVGSAYSWGHHGTKTLDSLLQQMAAQGQSFFQASGDSDAYTGSQALDPSSGPIPVDSIYVTSVGGTTLTMSGAAWSSETTWNWGGGTGSGGGVSPNYAIPAWQANVSMTANGGSTVNRNIPDVALTADGVAVIYDNGTSDVFGGTSCAAPLWAGFCALVNEQAIAAGGAPVGFLNPALYAVASGAKYAACFHDITTGNNTSNKTSGSFNAVTNYDLCTGLGAPNGTNLINALAPPASPYFITSPAGQTVAEGAGLTFSATVGGQAPLSYQWLFNGANLAAGGGISGVTSNVLSITSAAAGNSGNYNLVAANAFGSATSSVAVLIIGVPPSFSAQPANLTVLSGGNAVFSAAAGGSTPLAYQWRENGMNLVNGAGVSGATGNVLTLTAVTGGSAGNYDVSVTDSWGASTSSVATLTVVLPPSITGSTLTNQTVECGGNNVTCAVTASGTAPLNFQWSLDGAPVPGATTAALSLTNVHLPNHTVTLAVTNLYGTLTANALLSVHDTLPPVITLLGANPMFVELGAAFADPGATAYDTCAGVVPVAAGGAVNTSVVGTNLVVYTAGDGNGNTNGATRVVIVRDTTPPTITWSFTNLALAAGTNCGAPMPDVTGTNFIRATDLSGAPTITQSPTNQATLQLGTNVVVLTVKDASGNAAYSTNAVVVLDETPPVVTLNGANPLFVAFGGTFVDPGATADDACAGVVPVAAAGTVNTTVAGTNLVVYTADDGHGNTNTATRAVIVRDTTPTIVWSFTNLVLAAGADCGAPMPDVTGTNFILAGDPAGPLTISQSPTNNALLPLGTNLVIITVADALSNAAYSTNFVVVRDETPPVITLNGANPMFLPLGGAFTDPGATADDACAGVVPVSVNGSVNSLVVGTNLVVYTAGDGNGNTNTAIRAVIVRDTAPPTISWSFTNLVLAADTNCGASMPDVTGTNFILAADLAAMLTITQSPTNGTVLNLGTNLVVITVADVYGNAANSTNTVVVQDETPPLILIQPQSRTNIIGATATFAATATACTPLGYQQWVLRWRRVADEPNQCDADNWFGRFRRCRGLFSGHQRVRRRLEKRRRHVDGEFDFHQPRAEFVLQSVGLQG